jgi:hypothetical protein
MEDRVEELLLGASDGVLFFSGCAANQWKFYRHFNQIVLLSAPPDVLTERLRTRTSNAYGKRPEELAEVLENQRTIEPLIRRAATSEIDTSAPFDEVLAAVLRLAGDERGEPC